MGLIMKAFLLAAGKGTRLRPLTNDIPKCLVPIDHRNLLEIWIEELERVGVTDVLLNTHYRSSQVEAFARKRKGKRPNLTLFHEPTLLGSAGTIAANRAFIDGKSPFFILYADNLTRLPLDDFLNFHLAKNATFSIALFRSAEPKTCGIATLDEHDRVVAFTEKPEYPATPWANAGLYLANSNLFDLLPPGEFSDFGYHVLPKLVGQMYGFRYEGLFHDIGTMKRLYQARQDWMHTNERMT
ncbi:MAG: nucleotidyltransferase family protein [Spartobacteria bacterium]|nr:nucleotidyltransferase family protein [Spartobacteria bacterium]